MAVKEVKKETCKKVQLRRDAVSSRSGVPLVSSPRPRTLAGYRSVDGVPPVTSRPISPLHSPSEGSEDSPNASTHDHHEMTSSKDQIDCHRLSVDWILDSPYEEVAKLLRRLDIWKDSVLIVEMMLHYSLVIKGLPDCPEEDLQLAVYFFLEDTFSIQSKMVKCVKIAQYNGRMDVGVVFDSIRMKYDVLKKDELLKGTEVQIKNNHTLAWFGKHPGAPRL